VDADPLPFFPLSAHVAELIIFKTTPAAIPSLVVVLLSTAPELEPPPFSTAYASASAVLATRDPSSSLVLI
jgi:hypothetical protein